MVSFWLRGWWSHMQTTYTVTPPQPDGEDSVISTHTHAGEPAHTPNNSLQHHLWKKTRGTYELPALTYHGN